MQLARHAVRRGRNRKHGVICSHVICDVVKTEVVPSVSLENKEAFNVQI